jgi:CubicO group peptidase (beta-lactamase class C family)
MRNLIGSVWVCAVLVISLYPSATLAHNGASALVYPIKNVSIDGNLSDWAGVKRYALALALSDVRPKDANDFSGEFMIAYNLGEKALYMALEITDSDYVSDTTKQVAWNTQDAVQVFLDLRHFVEGSSVTSFLYSETYKPDDGKKLDAAAGFLGWDKVQVKMKRDGAKRVYEWKIVLGDALQPGRSIGFDVLAFDRDADGFGWNTWGPGGSKYQVASALGDIVFVKENAKTAKILGQVNTGNAAHEKIETYLRFTAVNTPQQWVTAHVDSVGNYAVTLPEGDYTVAFSERYIPTEKKLYMISSPPIPNIHVKTNGTVKAPAIQANVAEAPDLILEKGVLQTYNEKSSAVIDNFIETYQKYYKIPGVSLALIKDGKVVYHKVYGVKNSITKVPVNDSTLFEAASITKPVFAYAVQRLAERGVIDLDKPLYQYLPFKDIDYDERYKVITARHVLTHRTGFPNWREGGKLAINFAPGTKYGYSGEGFQYLQAVVEKITGKGVEQVLKEEVLDPLAMHHTFFSKNDRLMKLVSTGHFNGVPSSDDPPSSPGMAFSMHTEAVEFTRFMLQLLNQKGLSAATYANILSERSTYDFAENEKPKYNVYMGESLQVRDSPAGQAFGHGGNNGDFRCLFEVYKDAKMGYAIFTNSSTAYPLLEKMAFFLVEGKE